MVIDVFFENVGQYNVFYKLDVKVGEKFTLVMDKPEEMNDVFVNNDKVLSHEHKHTDINIEALSVGVSKVRIMKDTPEDTTNPTRVVREILINVVDQITRPASSLNVSFSESEQK